MIKASMYRMPELWIEVEVVFISMQITYLFAYFPSNCNTLAFLRLFDSLRFTLYYFWESWILSCEFTLLKGKNNFEETLCLQPRRYVSISLRFHLYANYPSFSGFFEDKNVAFDFSDAYLFENPVYFDYQVSISTYK